MSTAFCEDGSALGKNGFEDCESLDERVQFELERLNTATDLINKLEIELDVSVLILHKQVVFIVLFLFVDTLQKLACLLIIYRYRFGARGLPVN
ncbi:unnamed protein product, partial [Ixodes pacificus]